MENKPDSLPIGNAHVRVRRGSVDSVDLYEIKDSELDQLEKGSPADLQLNFSIFCISMAFSAICSLATATFANPRVETLFVVVAVVGILIGGYLLIAWIRNRSSLKELCKRIRSRIPPEVPSPTPLSGEDEGGPEVEKPSP